MARKPPGSGLWCMLIVAVTAVGFVGAATPSVRDVVEPLLAGRAAAGVVTAVANKEGILAIETFGFADLAQQRPMLADTVFWVASQTKLMTATAFMMLVDAGKVSVDDPVAKYLPEFKGQMIIAEQSETQVVLRPPSRPLLVRHLLSHTGGMRYKSPLEEPTLDGLVLRDAVRSYALQPLQWEPGSKYLYSNAGINTVARIIEVISGMSYEEFMRTQLFEPLEMEDTTFWPTEAQVRRLAKVYRPDRSQTSLEETVIEQLRYPLTDRTRFPIPSGGLFSTATDLSRFARMVLNGGELDGRRYLSAAAVNQMTSKQTPDALNAGYGFGWIVGKGEFGHGGALNTETSIDTTTGLITILLVHQAEFIGDGGKLRAEFKRVARERFGNTRSRRPDGVTGDR
jgi:CubicO group peptidase (beta-lactamase class C family)